MDARLPESYYSPQTGFGLFKPEQSIGYKRPAIVQENIDANFFELSQRNEYGYLFIGADNYHYNFFTRIGLDVSTIIKSIIESREQAQDKNPVYVLDIGAGNFRLTDTLQNQYGTKVKMYGITASDMFREDNKIIDEYHVLNNAENLSKVFPDLTFDLIVSRCTFMHLIDKIGSVMEAYKKLKPGGVLLIDVLFIPGCEKHLEEIIVWMQNKGYLLVCEHRSNSINSLIIKKPLDGTLDELIFPVKYNYLESYGVNYQPHLDIFNSTLQQEKRNAEEKELQNLYHELNKINPTLLTKYDNLPNLFDDNDYKNLHPIIKFSYILSINAKSLSQQNYETSLHTLRELSNKDNIFKGNVFENLLMFQGLYFYQLENTLSIESLKHITSDVQLKCIQVTAKMEISTRIQLKNVIKALNQLEIPYNENLYKLYIPYYVQPSCLDFPKLAESAGLACRFS